MPLVTRNKGLILVLATANQGDPEVAVIQKKEKATEFKTRGMGLDLGAAVAVAEIQKPQTALVRIRNSDLRGTEQDQVTLRLFEFPPPPKHDLTWGIRDIELAAQSALALDLPTDSKRWVLRIPQGVAAVFQSRGANLRTIWPHHQDLRIEAVDTADRLILLSTRLENTWLQIQLRPEQEAQSLVMGPNNLSQARQLDWP